MNNIFAGLQYLIDGFKLIFQPGLRRFAFIPLIINTILFIILFMVLIHYMAQFNTWFANHLPHWLSWLAGVIWVLVFISFFLILIYTFVWIANILAAPFNGLLAEKVEYYLTGKKLPSRTVFENVKDVPRVMGRQLGMLLFYVPWAVLILIIFFVPVVQAFAAFAWFVFNAWFMTLTYLDYPTDNHQIPLSEVRKMLREKPGLALGFGISVLVATMIPVLNFFVIPASVAAATKLWVEQGTSK